MICLSDEFVLTILNTSSSRYLQMKWNAQLRESRSYHVLQESCFSASARLFVWLCGYLSGHIICWYNRLWSIIFVWAHPHYPNQDNFLRIRCYLKRCYYVQCGRDELFFPHYQRAPCRGVRWRGSPAKLESKASTTVDQNHQVKWACKARRGSYHRHLDRHIYSNLTQIW